MTDSRLPFDFRNPPPGMDLRPEGFEVSAAGLLVPAWTRPTALDCAAAYIQADVYLPEDPRELQARVLREWPREDLVYGLAVLNNAFFHRETAALLDLYRKCLTPESLRKFDAWLAQPKRAFLAGQPILAAIKLVLASPEPVQPTRNLPLLIAAVVLSHAVAATLETEFPTEENLAEGVPAGIGIEMMQNAAFYDSIDRGTLVETHMSLWRESGRRISKTRLRNPPAELLREGTGLEVEDFLALGFALYAFLSTWRRPGDPFSVSNFGDLHRPEVIDRFLGAVAFTVDEYDARPTGRQGAWDFLALERRPVLRGDKKLIVLDPGFLLRRVTTGLYWFVHDHEIDRAARDRWSQAYGEMVEDQARGMVRAMAPTVIGGTAFYTEEDFARAYPGAKGREPQRCDIGIDFGADILLVEVRAKSLSVETRVEGAIERFKDDTDRLVIGEARQVHETARRFLADEGRLTGAPPVPRRRVVPVVVVGGGYPITPTTLPYIKQRLTEEGLLSDSSIDGLCILSPMELRRLQALHAEGESVPGVLRRWQSSALNAVPFHMFVDRESDLRSKLDAEAAKAPRPPPALAEVMRRLSVPKTKPPQRPALDEPAQEDAPGPDASPPTH